MAGLAALFEQHPSLMIDDVKLSGKFQRVLATASHLISRLASKTTDTVKIGFAFL